MTSAGDDTLPPWCARLIRESHASDARAQALAEPLTLPQLNWRASPELWSVGQCLDHLRVANEVYLSPITTALAGARPGTTSEITPGWFGRWFIASYIDPSPTSKKAPAPKKIKPQTDVAGDILERFLASNERARQAVRGASGYDVNAVRFQNPFIPIIYFSVGTGFEILSRHERRHLLQAERIRSSPGFPG